MESLSWRLGREFNTKAVSFLSVSFFATTSFLGRGIGMVRHHLFFGVCRGIGMALLGSLLFKYKSGKATFLRAGAVAIWGGVVS